MLTLEKIKIYKQCNGDVDFFSRSRPAKASAIIHEDDFYVIEGLVQDYFLIRMDRASPDFGINFHKRIHELCAPEEIVSILQELKAIKG